MKGKLLIASLLFLASTFLSCDYNDPAAPFGGYAYCTQDGEAHCHVVGSTGTYWGSIKNTGGSTAYNVRLVFEWIKTEDDSIVKQKTAYVKPSNLEANQSGTYYIEVKGLQRYSCICQSTIKCIPLP